MLTFNKQRLLIIAPHPDDEILGCGGLIKRVKDGGGQVFVVYITVGDSQDFSAKGVSKQNERIREIATVAKYSRLDGYQIALPGNKYHLKLDKVESFNLISILEQQLEKLRPTILATTQEYDYNQDHRAVARAVLAATRPAPLQDKHSPDLILGYHSVITAGWAQESSPVPKFHLEINGNDLNFKARALKLYKSQVRENGHQRTPKAVKMLARICGIWSGTEYAESYFIHRLLVLR